MAGAVRYHGPWDQPGRRFGWVPTVLIAGLLGLVLLWLTGLAALTGTALGDPRVPAARFAPEDGDSTVVRWDPGAGGTKTAGPRTGEVEQARFVGSEVLSAVPQPFLVRTEPVREPALSQTRWWRETVRDETRDDARLRLRSVSTDGIRLHGQSWGTNGVTFSPTLLELPADVRAGQEWESSGVVARDADGPSGTYEHHASATAPPDPELRSRHCLQVDQQTVITHRGRSIDWQETNIWCPGAGVVAQTGQFDRTSYTLAADRGPSTEFGTTVEPAEAGTVATWQDGPVDGYAGDATFGEKPYRPLTLGAPVVTSDAVVHSRSMASDDVYGTRSALTGTGTDRFVTDWWGRPGGTVVGMTALGDLVLVATTERNLVAYAGGVQRWSTPMDDVVLAAPVPVGTDRAAVATLAGTIQLIDLTDGHALWTAETEGGVTTTPVTDGRTVAAYDNDGKLTGWDAGTGEELFSSEVFRNNPESLVLAGGTVVMQHQADIDAYDLTDGTRIWTRPVVRDTEVAADGEQVVITRAQGTTALDAATGQQRWQAPPARAVTAVSGGWALLDGESLTIRALDGAELRSWAVTVQGDDPALLSAAGRVWVFSDDADVELSGHWFGVDR